MKCPTDKCAGTMTEGKGGVYKCATCSAIFIPKECAGIFVSISGSIIGIHEKKPKP